MNLRCLKVLALFLFFAKPDSFSQVLTLYPCLEIQKPAGFTARVPDLREFLCEKDVPAFLVKFDSADSSTRNINYIYLSESPFYISWQAMFLQKGSPQLSEKYWDPRIKFPFAVDSSQTDKNEFPNPLNHFRWKGEPIFIGVDYEQFPADNAYQITAFGTLDSLLGITITANGPLEKMEEIRATMFELLRSAKWFTPDEMDKKLGLPLPEGKRDSLDGAFYDSWAEKVIKDSTYPVRFRPAHSQTIVSKGFSFRKYFESVRQVWTGHLQQDEMLDYLAFGKTPACMGFMESFPIFGFVAPRGSDQNLYGRSYSQVFGNNFQWARPELSHLRDQDGKRGLLVMQARRFAQGESTDSVDIYLAEWTINSMGANRWNMKKLLLQLPARDEKPELVTEQFSKIVSTVMPAVPVNRFWMIRNYNGKASFAGLRDSLNFKPISIREPIYDTAYFDVVYRNLDIENKTCIGDYVLFFRSPEWADTIKKMEGLNVASGRRDLLNSQYWKQYIQSTLAAKHGKNIPREKRLYISKWIAANEKLYRFGVSFGVIEFYQVIEADGNQARERENSIELQNEVRNLPEFLQIQQLSMMQENILTGYLR